MSQSYTDFAVMLVGFPGSGKSTIGKMIVYRINLLFGREIAVYIDQDMFFEGTSSEKMAIACNKYLESIEKIVASNCIPVMGKGHHTKNTRRGVIDKIRSIKGPNFKCFAFDLVSLGLDRNPLKLLDDLMFRISHRPANTSPLPIEDAERVIRDIFMRYYQDVNQLEGIQVTKLDYLDSAETNVFKILNIVKIMWN